MTRKYLLTEKGEKTYRRGKVGEKKVLAAMGATATRRSGAGRNKGDGRKVLASGRVLHVEVKTTGRVSYALNKQYLLKLMHQTSGLRIPVLVTNFTTFPAMQWVTIPLREFEELTGAHVRE